VEKMFNIVVYLVKQLVVARRCLPATHRTMAGLENCCGSCGLRSIKRNSVSEKLRNKRLVVLVQLRRMNISACNRSKQD